LQSDLKDTLIIIPTFNEADNIGKLIEELFFLYPEISLLIVDDNSPDKTADIVRLYQDKYASLHLLERSEKEGLGPAYLDGFKWALKKPFQFFIQMDGDFSHAPKDVLRLIDALGEADLVIGSRYQDGGQTLNWPLSRKLISKVGSFVMKRLTKLPIQDATSGFKCFKRKALEKLNEIVIQSKGYVFQCEVNYRLFKNGIKITEVPIVFSQRTHGKSKMSLNIMLEAISILFQLRFSEPKRHERKSHH